MAPAEASSELGGSSCWPRRMGLSWRAFGTSRMRVLVAKLAADEQGRLAQQSQVLCELFRETLDLVAEDREQVECFKMICPCYLANGQG
jgi:hypothetical protein